MAKNPQIQAAYNRGKSEGYKLGLTHGRTEGQAAVALAIAGKLEQLPHVKGFGPKTLEKFIEYFGKEYFITKKDDKSNES
ncbi:hypothetical protein [Niallia sp. 03190]|uniref:hypothetical protein n=1 Tax=Niallia sp. 03190 TaxID=3458061 RepID=UPI004043FAB3